MQSGEPGDVAKLENKDSQVVSQCLSVSVSHVTRIMRKTRGAPAPVARVSVCLYTEGGGGREGGGKMLVKISRYFLSRISCKN